MISVLEYFSATVFQSTPDDFWKHKWGWVLEKSSFRLSSCCLIYFIWALLQLFFPFDFFINYSIFSSCQINVAFILQLATKYRFSLPACVCVCVLEARHSDKDQTDLAVTETPAWDTQALLLLRKSAIKKRKEEKSLKQPRGFSFIKKVFFFFITECVGMWNIIDKYSRISETAVRQSVCISVVLWLCSLMMNCQCF